MKFERQIPLLFLAIALVTFAPTIGAGFVYDFPGWQKEYEHGSFGDILTCFGYPGNHQLLHLFFYSFYKLFHISGWPWYLLFTGLHAINGWLLYMWMRKRPTFRTGWQTALPWMSTVLFLLHPYAVEAVVWKVCLHYLLSLGAVLGILILHERYLESGRRPDLYRVLALYGASLFLLELSFITPAVMVLWLGLQALGTKPGKEWLRRSVVLSLSLFSLLAAYLVLNRLTLGAWIGHYGASAHLAFDFLGVLSTELKYLVKHLLAARYYSFHAKTLLFDQVLSRPEVAFLFLVAGLSAAIWTILRRERLADRGRLAWFGLLGSLLFVLPVSNLYFMHLGVGMNDRYGYIPIAFLSVFLAAILARLPRWPGLTLMGILILGHVYLQQRTIGYWRESTRVLRSLKADFRWHDRSPVFILNSPDNYRGIVMTSIVNEPSGIHELIDYQTDKPFPGEMFDIFQLNMNGPMEGVRVEQTGPNQIKVTPNQWGNWWHRNGIGASPYENEYYKAELLDYPYLLTFKQFPAGSVILYQDSMRWKEFVLQSPPQ